MIFNAVTVLIILTRYCENEDKHMHTREADLTLSFVFYFCIVKNKYLVTHF